MQKKPRINFKDWQKLLVPEFHICAVGIEDRMVRVFCFDKNTDRVKKAGQYVLPKGIIEEGVLKKPEQLKCFFNSLKTKLWPKEKNVWVILSLPSVNFFIHILSIPELDEERFQEAIVFNTQMASPLSLEESYFDWEDWGPAEAEGEREVFVAVGIKNQINSYMNILQEAGFKVVAVEPLALSLARFNGEFLEDENPLLIISLRVEGVEFVIAEGKKLIFFDFDSWHEIFGKEIPSKITAEILQKHLGVEIPMLLNFYSLKRKKMIQHFSFLGFNKKLSDILTKWIQVQYQLAPVEAQLPPALAKVNSDWFGAIGAALRGLISRGEDTIVSLAPVGTERDYEQNRLVSIVSLWGKITVTVGIVMVMLFGMVNHFFFGVLEEEYSVATARPLDQNTIAKETNLKNQANEFNELVTQFSQARQYTDGWEEKLRTIFDGAASSSVNIKRVLVSAAPANNITVQGEAQRKDLIVDFKESLEEANLFSEISLPLSALVETSGGVTFSLSVKI